MERSLTVLLPVHNAESTLARTVHEVLEVVSELTSRIELVIVDDGSKDATSEVADDLIRHYPQVRTARHGERLGRDAAIRTGLKQSQGEIILLREETGGVELDRIAKLWRVTTEHLASTEVPEPKWTQTAGNQAGRRAGYRMIDRRLIDPQSGSTRPTEPNYLVRLREFALGE